MKPWVPACSFGVLLLIWCSFFWARHVKWPSAWRFDRWVVSDFQFTALSFVLGAGLLVGRSSMGDGVLAATACCAGLLVLGAHCIVESLGRRLRRDKDKPELSSAHVGTLHLTSGGGLPTVR